MHKREHAAVNQWTDRRELVAQIIARIHTTQVVVRRLIHNLLVKVGREHPQSLMYPLLVACKSQSSLRQKAAQSVVEAVRTHSPKLVEEAEMVRLEPAVINVVNRLNALSTFTSMSGLIG